MRSYCKVQLLGNVGQAPKVNESYSVASFSLATSEKQGEQYITTWWSCKAFGKLVEVIDQYVGKGYTLLIDGRMTINEWTDKDGVTHKDPQVLCDQVNIIQSGKAERGAQSDQVEQPQAEAEKPEPKPKERVVDTNVAPPKNNLPF